MTKHWKLCWRSIKIVDVQCGKSFTHFESSVQSRAFPRPLLAICLTERSQETCKMFKKTLHFPNHIFWSHWVPSKCQASKLKLRSNSILCGALAHFYDEGKAKGRSKGRPSEYDDLWCQSHSIPSKRIWKYVLFMHVAFKVASHNLCKITKCMPQQVVLTSWRLHLRFICDPKWPEQRVCRVSKNVVAFALSAIALDS